jgi:hypothetical protein
LTAAKTQAHHRREPKRRRRETPCTKLFPPYDHGADEPMPSKVPSGSRIKSIGQRVATFARYGSCRLTWIIEIAAASMRNMADGAIVLAATEPDGGAGGGPMG